MRNIKTHIAGVSILLVMDDGLWAGSNPIYRVWARVSILLVMDDGLWAIFASCSNNEQRIVSILLVMDDGLWGFCSLKSQHCPAGLNPSCNG